MKRNSTLVIARGTVCGPTEVFSEISICRDKMECSSARSSILPRRCGCLKRSSLPMVAKFSEFNRCFRPKLCMVFFVFHFLFFRGGWFLNGVLQVHTCSKVIVPRANYIATLENIHSYNPTSTRPPPSSGHQLIQKKQSHKVNFWGQGFELVSTFRKGGKRDENEETDRQGTAVISWMYGGNLLKHMERQAPAIQC